MDDTLETRRRLGPQVLRRLIDEKLQLQEAQRLGIGVTESELAQAIGAIEQQNKLPRGGLETQTRRDGIDFSQLQAQIKADMAWGRVVRRNFSAIVKVGEDEISMTLDEIKKDRGQPQYLLAEIFFAVDNPSNEEEVRQLAERTAQQIKSGAPFQGLARQFSQSASAAAGGDIGWVRKSQLPDEIAAVLVNTQAGQLTAPIRTIAGWHLLLLRDRKAGGAAMPDEVTLDLAQIFLPAPPKAKPAEMRVLADLIKVSADTALNCEDMEKMAKELGSPQPSRVGKVNMASMPEEMRRAVSDVPVGKAGAAIPAPGGAVVFMVCERQEKSDLPTREDIAKRLENEKVDALARRHLRDLRRSAVIDIRI
jgi:peptidyl-prolyl cis-trans isomerase SurA